MSVLPGGVHYPNRRGWQHVPEYLRKVMSWNVDIDYTMYQMVNLCINPKKVYKLTTHRKQTKGQWARDDATFVLLQLGFLAVAAFAYGIAFHRPVTEFIWLLFNVIGQFFLPGLLISTLTWYWANNKLKQTAPHSVEQDVEWLYSFDVHCNAFFPCFILLYVVQYFLLPIVVHQNFFAILIGNSLYMAAAVVYCYITFEGYLVLPFIQKANVFLVPIGVSAVAYLLSLLFRFPLAYHILSHYFS